MPLNCSRGLLEYNACLNCRYQHMNECWFNLPITIKLSDILTLSERIAILEDRKEPPEVNIVTISKQDYQQLQRLILSIQEKINSHVDATATGNKYTYDTIKLDMETRNGK